MNDEIKRQIADLMVAWKKALIENRDRDAIRLHEKIEKLREQLTQNK